MAAHVPATLVNGLVQAWVFNSTRGSVLMAMLVHGSMNATAGFMLQLIEQTGRAAPAAEYYAISTVSFGLLMIVVAMGTRLQFGARTRR